MKFRASILLAFVCWLAQPAKAQRPVSDSAAAAKTLNTLFRLYTGTASTSPAGNEDALYRKAAQYIIYRGEDKRRKWKDFCNYKNAGDHSEIIDICGRIGNIIYPDPVYRITAYEKRLESEGQWHALTVIFTKGGEERHFIFAFLKIGDHYGLGDIDKAD